MNKIHLHSVWQILKKFGSSSKCNVVQKETRNYRMYVVWFSEDSKEYKVWRLESQYTLRYREQTLEKWLDQDYWWSKNCDNISTLNVSFIQLYICILHFNKILSPKCVFAGWSRKHQWEMSKLTFFEWRELFLKMLNCKQNSIISLYMDLVSILSNSRGNHSFGFSI